MGFGDAVKTCLTKYVVFEGRAARPEFWWFVLFSVAAEVAAFIIADAIGVTLLYTIVWLGLVLPSIAVAVRRLHDTGRSGWWYLLALTGIGVIVLIVFWVGEGNPGQNEYGPPPGGAAMGGTAAPPPPPPPA